MSTKMDKNEASTEQTAEKNETGLNTSVCPAIRSGQRHSNLLS